MNSFTIEIKETLIRLIEVEGASKEEALEKAKDLYYECEVLLSENDLVETEFCIFESDE